MTVPAEFAHLPFRPCVGMMLLNAKGEVFVARRIDMPSEAWQMPQGGIDEGEAPDVALFREMREEIGTDKAEVLAESAGWYDYDLPPELLGKLWGGRYRGQRQKWFALRFTGRDADVNIATEVPEFLAWKWAPIAQVPELIVPFKRALYQKIVAEFAPVAERLAAKG
ncbi:MAG TPA: RNA pyrophosphohydrolase [Alphaproteobacteria bacterium]|jgi:putative (di)nucleoside polyphosphate hydrolase